MIKTTRMLLEKLNGYSSPRSKLFSTADNGEYFPIAKGPHKTDKSTPRHLLTGSASATMIREGKIP